MSISFIKIDKSLQTVSSWKSASRRYQHGVLSVQCWRLELTEIAIDMGRQRY